MTHALLQVATVLMKDPDARHWGYDTARSAGVRSATLYRVLGRMHEDGWLADGWEDPAEIGGRPPRRYYTVTELGRDKMQVLREKP
jgi:PadR family transcriptional regulator PadR